MGAAELLVEGVECRRRVFAHASIRLFSTLHTISRVRGEKKLWYMQKMHHPRNMESVAIEKVDTKGRKKQKLGTKMA